MLHLDRHLNHCLGGKRAPDSWLFLALVDKTAFYAASAVFHRDSVARYIFTKPHSMKSLKLPPLPSLKSQISNLNPHWVIVELVRVIDKF